jgi:hypothetical protein
VREQALRHGKTVYMAVPRLKEEKMFFKKKYSLLSIENERLCVKI